jgi:4-amino-4-deoxy-L-arabinose transferase-like glycosyltransferase
MVPTYAPGLPLMMAAAVRVAGVCGPYLVVPLFAALLVWLTFLWGRRTAGPAAGLIAAIIVLTSPVVLFQTLWPMSDIPAAALWTGAAVAALTASRRGALGTGLLTAAGLLVRPNLPIVALVPIAQVAFGGRGRERLIRLALSAAPVAVAAVFIAFLNATWYGAPLNSGYGGLQELYSRENVWPNVTRYSRWLWQSQSGWVVTAAIPLFLRSTRVSAPIRLAYLLTATTVISYLAYFPFNDWWYLRFMLPAAGAVAVLMATGIVAIARQLPPLWGRAAAFFVMLAILIHTTKFSAHHALFVIQSNERRYVDVGAFVARSVPDNAVVFTMQHSGSVRFYGGRMSLRYDFMDRDWSPKALGELEGLGYHPFLVIDDWEAPEVRKAFQLPPESALPWRLMARLESQGGVSVFDMSSSSPPAPPVSIDAGRQPWCLAPQPMVLRRR